MAHIKKTTVKKAVRLVCLSLAALLLGAGIYAGIFSLYMKQVKKESIPMPFGFGASLVMSGSMEPTITTDDLIFIRKANNYELGDIVLYQSGNSYVVHRIVRMEEDSIVTKGDANNTEDEPIERSSVKGVYVGKIPGAGTFIRILQNPAVILTVFFVLAVGIFTVIYIENRNRQRRIEAIKANIEVLKTEIEKLRSGAQDGKGNEKETEK